MGFVANSGDVGGDEYQISIPDLHTPCNSLAGRLKRFQSVRSSQTRLRGSQVSLRDNLSVYLTSLLLSSSPATPQKKTEDSFFCNNIDIFLIVIMNDCNAQFQV